ncbi:MAG: chemotaxis protein CheA [Methylophilaceae bacterium]
MSQFFQVFFDESGEHLAEMERLLLELNIDEPDTEQLNAIFRAAHSIKGGSGTFGFTDMTDVTHVLENLLDRLRKAEMTMRAEMVDVFLEAADVLKAQLVCHINDTPSDVASAQAVCEKLRALTQDQVPTTAPVAESAKKMPAPAAPVAARQETNTRPINTIYEIVFRPGKSFQKRKNSSKELLIQLTNLGALEVLSQPDDEEKPSSSKKDKKSSKGKKSAEWRFRLTTSASLDDINEAFSFFATPEEVEVHKTDAPEASAPAIAEDDPGFGFFTDDPVPVATAEEDPGYGFFGDIVTPVTIAEEGDGFGFFVPVAPPAAAAAPVTEDKPAAFERRDGPRAAPTASSAAPAESSIRVSVEKVDQLINLVGELVITQAMLAQTASTVDPALYEALNTGMGQLERNTRDLQESVMSIRMMPISFVFSRFPRVVRDLAGKLNKQVDLVTVGENTELDKGLIEKIADPLTHLVRNSLDHGIEPPEARLAAGKPAKGTIRLSASHQGGNILIEVSDDGAGLSRERILGKAKEKGLDVSDSMTDADVWQLIFAPGFSTAAVVTDVSGRGVGMDVVKRNITEMGGVVGIDSYTGKGSKITIRLPLTLAILDGMSVSLGNNLYVIPLNLIVETLQPRAEDLRTVAGEGSMVQVRGEYLPIIALHTLFNMPTQVTDPCQGVLVLIEAQGKKAALFVDALVGQQQVVIKSLETNFRRILGVSGATIMGDGTVALIIDVPTVIRLGQTSMKERII